jgi:hypothetical protein
VSTRRRHQFCKRGHDTELTGTTGKNLGCRQCGKDRSLKWQQEHPINRERALYKYHYGIEVASKSKQIEQQKVCPICKREPNEFENNWHVDHDHATNKVRGIICRTCNLLLGSCRDSTVVLSAAIIYLNCPQTRDNCTEYIREAI